VLGEGASISNEKRRDRTTKRKEKRERYGGEADYPQSEKEKRGAFTPEEGNSAALVEKLAEGTDSLKEREKYYLSGGKNEPQYSHKATEEV